MHVKARKMAFGGLLLALSVVFMALGSIIESSTLFLLAAASYFVGIMIRETGIKTGAAFYIAAVLLGLMVAPNKMYVVSFAIMGFYILAIEQAHRMLGRTKGKANRKVLFWILKYLLFNVLYIPVLILFQQVLFGRTFSPIWLVVFIIVGQIGLWIYDRAYEYTQSHIWAKYRGRIMGA